MNMWFNIGLMYWGFAILSGILIRLNWTSAEFAYSLCITNAISAIIFIVVAIIEQENRYKAGNRHRGE